MFSHFSLDLFSITIIAILAGGFLYVFYYQWKVRRQGLEATAVVTWIEEKETSDEDGVSYYYDIHVAYTTRDNRDIEGLISNPNHPFEEGERLLIKYLPGKEEYPVYISKL